MTIKKFKFSSELSYDFSLISALLATVFISHFPPKSPIQHVSQVFPFVLWTLILTKPHFRESIVNLFLRRSKGPIFVILSFLAFSAVSLLYSGNQRYGVEKLLGLVFGILPTIVAFYLILTRVTWQQIQILTNLLVILGIGFTAVLYSSDLDFKDGKENILFWTHVGTGRFLGFAFLASLYNYHSKKTLLNYANKGDYVVYNFMDNKELFVFSEPEFKRNYEIIGNRQEIFEKYAKYIRK